MMVVVVCGLSELGVLYIDLSTGKYAVYCFYIIIMMALAAQTE